MKHNNQLLPQLHNKGWRGWCQGKGELKILRAISQNRSSLLFLSSCAKKSSPATGPWASESISPLEESNSLQQAFVDMNSMLPGAFVCFTHNSHFSFLHAFFIVCPEAMSWLPSGAPRLGSKSLQITGLRVLMEHSAGWSWHIRN